MTHAILYVDDYDDDDDDDKMELCLIYSDIYLGHWRRRRRRKQKDKEVVVVLDEEEEEEWEGRRRGGTIVFKIPMQIYLLCRQEFFKLDK